MSIVCSNQNTQNEIKVEVGIFEMDEDIDKSLDQERLCASKRNTDNPSDLSLDELNALTALYAMSSRPVSYKIV